MPPSSLGNPGAPDELQQSAQSDPDNLRLFESELGRELRQNLNILIRETDSGRLSNSFHKNSLTDRSAEAVNPVHVHHAIDIPLESEISDFRKSVNKVFSTDPKALRSPLPPLDPLDWILDPGKSATFVNRVLARLVQAEAHESNPHYRDDYRQTFISISLWQKGEFSSFQDSFVAASYKMYGIHPDQVWTRILLSRQAMLGPEGLSKFPNKKPRSPKTDAQKAGIA